MFIPVHSPRLCKPNYSSEWAKIACVLHIGLGRVGNAYSDLIGILGDVYASTVEKI